MTKSSRVLVGKPSYFMQLVVDGVIKFKYVTKKQNVTMWTLFV